MVHNTIETILKKELTPSLFTSASTNFVSAARTVERGSSGYFSAID